MATEVLQQYGSLQFESDVMRCKLYALLLPAYAILGDRERFEQMFGMIQSLLPIIRAEQSRALLLVTLYGYTSNCLYHDQAHALIDVWCREQPLKKSKARLLGWLDDYDHWFGLVPNP